MGKLKVLAGSWHTGDGSFSGTTFALPKSKSWADWEIVQAASLTTIEIASEESVKRVGGTLGWGVAGAALLGPVGLLAGLLMGGRRKEVTFVASFKDGRKLMATTDNKTFVMMKAASI